MQGSGSGLIDRDYIPGFGYVDSQTALVCNPDCHPIELRQDSDAKPRLPDPPDHLLTGWPLAFVLVWAMLVVGGIFAIARLGHTAKAKR